MATTAQRQHLHSLASWCVAHASHFLYPPGDVRQHQDAVDWNLTEQQAEHLVNGGGTMMFDCSEWCAWLLKAIGIWPFSQPGWTGSDLAWHGFPHYTDGKIALVGALVVFGYPPGHHMAMVTTPDPKHGNPGITGHGGPGITVNTVADEAKYQPAGITYLSIAHL